MRALRSQEFGTRRQSYCVGRIQDQINWYAAKSKSNERGARRWGRATFGANIIGLLGAGGRFLGWIDIDILGVAAAGAAAGTAWIQLKQHRTLAASYALAAQELSLALVRLENARDDEHWALEVSDAEEAISREHTMWLARHGHTF
jgi:hypothetical protein